MVTRPNFDTGTSGGGSTSSVNPSTRAKGLTGLGSGGSGAASPRFANQKFSEGLSRQAAGTTSGSSGSVSSNAWTCPDGATLTRESTGSGNLVCRWNHNGAEFQAIPRAGSGGSASSGGGGSGAGAGGTSPGASGGGDSRWIQSAADTFARNPEAMLSLLLEEQYGDTGGNSLYGQLKPYADAANVLFLAQGGNTADGGTKDDFLSYLEDYWGLLQTPGARLDSQGALSNIMNPSEGSPLHSYLSQGNPEDQASNLLRLMSGVYQTSYHPLIAQSVMDRLGLEADRYMGRSGEGAVDPFYSTLNLQIPGFSNLIPGG